MPTRKSQPSEISERVLEQQGYDACLHRISQEQHKTRTDTSEWLLVRAGDVRGEETERPVRATQNNKKRFPTICRPTSKSRGEPVRVLKVACESNAKHTACLNEVKLRKTDNEMAACKSRSTTKIVASVSDIRTKSHKGVRARESSEEGCS